MDILLQGVVGSTAYGMAGPGSDIDTLGTFRAPTTDILGLSGRSVADSTHTTSAPAPDSTLHEVGKMLRLAMKNNPTCMELLWLPEYQICSEAGAKILAIRSAFAYTTGVRNSYGGYARQQAQRLLRQDNRPGIEIERTRARTSKHARHCMRLTYQATDLLRTGELVLDMTERRAELFAAGDLAASDPTAFGELFQRALTAMDATASVLPDHPDREAIEVLLVELRLDQLRAAVPL
jgi:hypothetical protein